MDLQLEKLIMDKGTQLDSAYTQLLLADITRKFEKEWRILK